MVTNILAKDKLASLRVPSIIVSEDRLLRVT